MVTSYDPQTERINEYLIIEYLILSVSATKSYEKLEKMITPSSSAPVNYPPHVIKVRAKKSFSLKFLVPVDL